jgi:hypothetical protein
MILITTTSDSGGEYSYSPTEPAVMPEGWIPPCIQQAILLGAEILHAPDRSRFLLDYKPTEPS